MQTDIYFAFIIWIYPISLGNHIVDYENCTKEFLPINPKGLIELGNLLFATPYEVTDAKQQSSTSAKNTRQEVDGECIHPRDSTNQS